jgi:ATP synthase protein I
MTKVRRKLEARRGKKPSLYFGLGMFGLIGWSVAIPTVLGIALGIWIDNTWPSRFSWTLMLLVLGVLLGCVNAWHWMQRESPPADKSSRRAGRS